jgi:hypothetical protein
LPVCFRDLAPDGGEDEEAMLKENEPSGLVIVAVGVRADLGEDHCDFDKGEADSEEAKLTQSGSMPSVLGRLEPEIDHLGLEVAWAHCRPFRVIVQVGLQDSRSVSRRE